jgi:hypothetical protein
MKQKFKKKKKSKGLNCMLSKEELGQQECLQFHILPVFLCDPASGEVCFRLLLQFTFPLPASIS